MFNVLRRRDFALLWTGGLISLAGDWVKAAALPFFVYQQSHSTLATASIVAAGLIPRFVFGSLAGVFVDRWDRRRVMVVTSLCQAAALLPLLLVHSGSELWIVFLVRFVQTSLATFFGPAENALLPNLVAQDELVSANALNALNNNLARLVGPPLGGLLLAQWGLPGVVLFDSLTFLAGAGMIALIRPVRPAAGALPPAAGGRRAAPEAPLEAGEKAAPGAARHHPAAGAAATWAAARTFWAGLYRDWQAGIHIVRRERVVRVLFWSVVILNLGGVMMDPLSAPYIAQVVGAGPQVFGWLMTAQAIGGLAGGLLAARLGPRLSPVVIYAWGEIALGAVLLVRFNIPELPVVVVTTLLTGLPAAVGAAGLATLFQQQVPNAYLGRVEGALNTSMALVGLLGVMGLSGALGEALGVVAVLNIAVIITTLNGVFVLAALYRPGGAAHRQPTRQPSEKRGA